MENVSRAQTADRQIFALVLLLEHMSVQISVELLSCWWGGGGVWGFPVLVTAVFFLLSCCTEIFRLRSASSFDLAARSLNL